MVAACNRKFLLFILIPVFMLAGCQHYVTFRTEQIAEVSVPFEPDSQLIDNCYQYQYDSKTQKIWFYKNFRVFAQDGSAHYWATVLSLSAESYQVNTFLDLTADEKIISAMYYDDINQSIYIATYKVGLAHSYIDSEFALNCYSIDGKLNWTKEVESKIISISRRGDIRITCDLGVDQQVFWLNELLQTTATTVPPSSVYDVMQNEDTSAQVMMDTEKKQICIQVVRQGHEMQTRCFEDIYPAQIELLYLLEDKLIYRYDAQIICWDFHLNAEDVLMETDNWPIQCIIRPLDNDQILIGVLHDKGVKYFFTENIYDMKERKIVSSKAIQMERDENLDYRPTLFYYSEVQELIGVYRHKDDSVQVYRYIIGDEKAKGISVMPG